MKIEIYGPGCARCHTTETVIRQAVASSGVAAEVVKITDVEAMLDKGVLKTPAVFIDGKKIVEGRVPTEAEIKQLLNT